jgi:glycerophosphoryl diester phosphodiesterase
MLIYAHRGASGAHPENTLLAFEAALAAGVEGIELDVHATADGVPVVIHDRAVERTTNGRGYVDELPLESLRRFDAGDSQQVPTLAEVLELVAGRAHLDIELKGAGIERATLAVLAAYPRVRWAISSFDWETLRRLRGLDEAIDLWPLAERFEDTLITIAAELASPVVALFAGAYDPESAALLAGEELGAMVWTVNDAAEARRVRDLGAYALCTDVPEQIMPAIHRSHRA